MAFKFCASFFSSSTEALDGKRGHERQALAEVLLDAGDAVWEKEFRVLFDGSRPSGLGFQPLAAERRFSRRHSTSSFVAASAAAAADAGDPQGDYACVVQEIAPDGLAAEHNARSQSLGDYSRLIRPGLRVRKVNGDDVAGMTYDRVLHTLRAAAPVFVVTFADARSRRVAAVRLDAPSSSRRRSSVSAAPGLPFAPDASSVIRATARRSSSSSIVLLASGTNDAGARVSGDDALVGDLDAKTREVSEQLQRVTQQVREAEREKQQLLQERDDAKRALEADRLRLREERDQLLVSQRQSAGDLLAAAVESERREASSLRAERDAAHAQLQRQHDQRSGSESELERRLAQQLRSCDELVARVAELRDEKEELQLARDELRLELADAAQHVEELHSRLVQAQSQQRAAEQQLALATDELAQTTQQLRELAQGIQTILTGANDPLALASQHQQEAPLASLRQVQEERRAVEKHRDELLVEASRYEHLLQSSQLEGEELAASNAALRDEITVLRAEVEREQQLRGESRRPETQQQTHDELAQQIRALETRCDAESAEKQQLRAALDALEAVARAKQEAQARDLEFLARFKQQLAGGVAVTKHGTRGSPHARVLFADVGCRWISWKPPSSGASLASPRADARVETRDLVEVLAGAATEVFQRHKPEAPAKCLSLVFVHPIRTLDIEAESADACERLLRGFRLLLIDAASKRGGAHES